jgi:hypothetical protein
MGGTIVQEPASTLVRIVPSSPVATQLCGPCVTLLRNRLVGVATSVQFVPSALVMIVPPAPVATNRSSEAAMPCRSFEVGGTIRCHKTPNVLAVTLVTTMLVEKKFVKMLVIV